MKTFTRRSSKQLSSAEPSPEKSQQPSQPASRKPKGSSQLHTAVERDPYSFEEIEDDTVAARPEQPGPPKVTTTKGEARPQVCVAWGAAPPIQTGTPAITDMLALRAGQTWQQEVWRHRQPCNLNSY